MNSFTLKYANLDVALNDEDLGVRITAIKHPKATKEHITKALDDEDFDVRQLAKEIQERFSK